jgi:hypothetical protein
MQWKSGKGQEYKQKYTRCGNKYSNNKKENNKIWG